jgi:hypothetical protein
MRHKQLNAKIKQLIKIVLTLNAQISAQERFSHIHMLYLDLYVIYLTLGLLRPMEFAPCPQE